MDFIKHSYFSIGPRTGPRPGPDRASSGPRPGLVQYIFEWQVEKIMWLNQRQDCKI